ncbi:integrase [Geomicrobium halophilum]|uniref:Integrase n=1 Tax=Geomicrobium halophilum TaxID=549000 RepID=A0A841PR11_9BACL|nr:tyrosine-type recombinase/integrase [Geomicrobium halophilum]MBB6449616.1 integrase [Geomicrobium halophilum]
MANEVNAIKSKRDRNKMKNALHGRNRLLFTVGVSLGLRISDLLTLKVGDLRGKETLVLPEQKTGKTRYIKLNATVRKEMKELTGVSDEEYLFRSAKGDNRPISRVHAHRILNDAAKRAGIADKVGAIGTHTLRKTHGYILHDNGTDITRIMTMMGHSTPAMTLKYIGVTKDEIDQAYEAIEV